MILLLYWNFHFIVLEKWYFELYIVRAYLFYYRFVDDFYSAT